jgi:hypothetical protein
LSLFRKWVVVTTVTATAMLGAAGTAAAAPRTPPGGDAAFQVEISGNVGGPTGGGSWYWLELDKDGGGIYAGSDCAHGTGASGARGTLSWERQGGQLAIHGVVSLGLPPFAYEPILVPAAYGHYVETFAQVFPTLTAFLISVGADVSKGSVQVQVAP